VRILLLISLIIACPAAFGASAFRLATFSCDITPPIGHACMGGGIEAAREIVDPLYARGIVLLGGDAPVVLCALDWCEVRNDAYTHLQQALADAAATTRDRVLLASVHQHDTPVADFAAQAMLDSVGLPQALCDVDFVKEIARKIALSLTAALEAPRAITHYGVGKGLVDGVASNRRVVAPDGSVSFPRNSATTDPAMHAAPEGLIDPYLRTLSFWNESTPVAALHVYAVHPMSYYGKGGVTADFPGAARARRQADAPDVFQVYFSGCSGDVTAGKFNDGSVGNRPMLADRLYQGMRRAWDDTRRHALDRIEVRTTPLQLPVRATGDYTPDQLRATLHNESARTFDRNLAALGLSWQARDARGEPIQIPSLHLGDAVFLQLPGEAFVGYQLYAQEQARGAFVLTAGYGECAPGYIPSASAEQEDFIATHSWCWVEPGAAAALEAAIRAALAPR